MAVNVKLCLVVLLVAAAVAPNLGSDHRWARASGFDSMDFTSDLIDNDIRRRLFEYGFRYSNPRNKYLSYKALEKNNAPCRRRGSSYYDCSKRRTANPYRRGCTAITGCARFTD